MKTEAQVRAYLAEWESLKPENNIEEIYLKNVIAVLKFVLE